MHTACKPVATSDTLVDAGILPSNYSSSTSCIRLLREEREPPPPFPPGHHLTPGAARIPPPRCGCVILPTLLTTHLPVCPAVQLASSSLAFCPCAVNGDQLPETRHSIPRSIQLLPRLAVVESKLVLEPNYCLRRLSPVPDYFYPPPSSLSASPAWFHHACTGGCPRLPAKRTTASLPGSTELDIACHWMDAMQLTNTSDSEM